MAALSIADIRGLFATEAEQRLSRLGQLVLDLEQRSDDGGPLVGEIFREVHTLKGSAAVVGFDAVAGFAHELEGRLEQLRSGAVASNPVIVDALLVAVDRLGVMIRASVAGHVIGDEDAAADVALDGLASAFDSAVVSLLQPDDGPSETRSPDAVAAEAQAEAEAEAVVGVVSPVPAPRAALVRGSPVQPVTVPRRAAGERESDRRAACGWAPLQGSTW